jgi:hypothetical protein
MANEFTRGGLKVNAHPVGGGAQGPRRRKTVSPGGKSYDPGQIGAIIGAGAITGLVGLGVVGALREGFGGDGRFGNKKR